MYEYQKNGFFAQVTGKMESLCEEELIELGAAETKTTYKGVFFKADITTLYKINYTSRLLSRVLAPLITFPCHTTNILKQKTKKIHWEDFCSIKKTFAISASVSKSRITNSLYASQCLKDGIADYFREKYGKRPDVEVVNPDVRFNLHVDKDTVRGSDKSQKAIEVAKENLSHLPYSDSVDLTCKPFQQVNKFENETIIANPPYGMRLGEFEEVQALYKEFGDFLKTNCTGTSAFIYTGNPDLRKSIGLKTTRRIPLDNGKLEGVLLQIDSYEGSRKKFFSKDNSS
jgi:23S rRNA G2445 N2-methylase RlmL